MENKNLKGDKAIEKFLEDLPLMNLTNNTDNKELRKINNLLEKSNDKRVNKKN